MLQREIIADASPVALRCSLCRLARIAGWDFPDLTAPYWRCYVLLDPGAELVVDGRTLPLAPGRAWLIAPGTACATRTRRPFRKLYLDFTWAPAGLDARPGIHAAPLAPAHRAALARIADGTPAPADGLARLGQAIVAAALASLPAGAFTAAAEHPPEVRAALAAIRADPGRIPGNAELARVAGCHPATLVRLFAASLGQTPQRWAMGLRLERAAGLLASGDQPIPAIAAACGFCDRNHFTRAFTRRWRCPPAEFRRRNR